MENNKSDYFVKGEQHRLKYRYSLATSDFVKGCYNECDKCQLALGIFYEYGIYVEQNYKKAVELWEKSFEQGNIEATYRLAQAYNNGWGVIKDYEKGQQLFEKAYEQGCLDAERYIDINIIKVKKIKNNKDNKNG